MRRGFVDATQSREIGGWRSSLTDSLFESFPSPASTPGPAQSHGTVPSLRRRWCDSVRAKPPCVDSPSEPHAEAHTHTVQLWREEWEQGADMRVCDLEAKGVDGYWVSPHRHESVKGDWHLLSVRFYAAANACGRGEAIMLARVVSGTTGPGGGETSRILEASSIVHVCLTCSVCSHVA